MLRSENKPANLIPLSILTTVNDAQMSNIKSETMNIPFYLYPLPPILVVLSLSNEGPKSPKPGPGFHSETRSIVEHHSEI